MGTPLVLTFDIGTQSARCVLVKPDGSFEDMCQVKYDEPYYSRNPGWAEQRPNFYYDRICETAKVICSRNTDIMDDIIAVTLTTIRDTVLCLDEYNKPLRDIILWLDARQASFKGYPFLTKMMFKVAGMEEASKILFRASASNWIEQNQLDIWKRTKQYVMLPCYLHYKMTGVLVDSIANIIGHMPLDYKRRKWRGEKNLKRSVCDVPLSKLCKLVDSGEVIGNITETFSKDSGVPVGLPLIATGSDKGCETIGLSVTKPNKAAISLGTTATIQMSVKKYFEPIQFMPAYPAVPNDMYNPEIEIFRGFWMLTWFIKEFAAEERALAKAKGCATEEILDEYIKKIPAGCNGLMLQPHWTPGIMTPYTKGSVIGFADYHTRFHLYRAIIEGIGYELYDSLKLMEKRSGLKIDELYVAGGGAKSDNVCQIIADIFGLPVKRIQTSEASSIGSAMVAFIAEGVFKDYDEATEHMVHEKDVFIPDVDNHDTYMNLYNMAYKKLLGKVYPLYTKTFKYYRRKENEQ